MRAILVVALTLTLLSGCCGVGNVRYWKARDLSSGKTFYTVDTIAVPLSGQAGVEFVSAEGRIVRLSSYELQTIDREEFERATGRKAGAWVDLSNFKCEAYID